MIAPLRKAHRLIWLVIAATLPLGFGAGLNARRPLPQGAHALTPPMSAADMSDSQSLPDLTWPGGRLAVRLAANEGLLTLTPIAVEQRPDVLVYLVPDAAAGASKVPDDAILLGQLSGAATVTMVLPSTPNGGRPFDGRAALMLYSLGHQEVLGTCTLTLTDGNS